jgi:predicted choloylglycine hydrolase
VVSAVVGITLATGGFVNGIGATGLAAGTTLVLVPEPRDGFVAYLLLWGSVRCIPVSQRGCGVRLFP